MMLVLMLSVANLVTGTDLRAKASSSPAGRHSTCSLEVKAGLPLTYPHLLSQEGASSGRL